MPPQFTIPTTKAYFGFRPRISPALLKNLLEFDTNKEYHFLHPWGLMIRPVFSFGAVGG
jgi:hypothetical protein